MASPALFVHAFAFLCISGAACLVHLLGLDTLDLGNRQPEARQPVTRQQFPVKTDQKPAICLLLASCVSICSLSTLPRQTPQCLSPPSERSTPKNSKTLRLPSYLPAPAIGNVLAHINIYTTLRQSDTKPANPSARPAAKCPPANRRSGSTAHRTTKLLGRYILTLADT